MELSDDSGDNAEDDEDASVAGDSENEESSEYATDADDSEKEEESNLSCQTPGE